MLFLDNAAPHPHLKLKNVELIFFPPNMTSAIQPVDQGIIQQFKKLYRKHFLRKVISMDDAGSGINVLDAIYWIAAAQKEVNPQTVRKCFLRSGVRHHDEDEDTLGDDEDDDTFDTELTSLIHAVDASVSLYQRRNISLSIRS